MNYGTFVRLDISTTLYPINVMSSKSDFLPAKVVAQQSTTKKTDLIEQKLC